jgi:hypothetical protein
LPKGDSIHLYRITSSPNSILSNRIQEFGKADRPGKREITKIKITITYVDKGRKNNRRNILSFNVCYNKYI